jgi:hypothetical protein
LVRTIDVAVIVRVGRHLLSLGTFEETGTGDKQAIRVFGLQRRARFGKHLDSESVTLVCTEDGKVDVALIGAWRDLVRAHQCRSHDRNELASGVQLVDLQVKVAEWYWAAFGQHVGQYNGRHHLVVLGCKVERIRQVRCTQLALNANAKCQVKSGGSR